MYAKQISYTKLLPCFEIIPHYWINNIWHNAWKPTLTSVCGLLSKLWTNYLLSLWVLHLPTAVLLQNQVFSTPKFLNSSGSPGSSRAILMGCPMWVHIRAHLGLAHSISPHLCGGDIHLDFCWVPKRSSRRMRGRDGEEDERRAFTW